MLHPSCTLMKMKLTVSNNGVKLQVISPQGQRGVGYNNINVAR